MDQRKQQIKRSRRTNRKQQPRKERTPAASPESEMTHWLTTAVWTRRCEVCGITGCVAYRHFDQSSLCDLCIERLGVEVRESKAWKREMRRPV